MSVDLDSRTIRHWINKRSVDSYKTLILPRGIDIARFQKSPSVWMNHDYSLKSILGKNLEVEVRDDGVVALTQTAPRPPSLSESVEWAPDTILWLHKTGDLRGWSIGFDPVESQRPSEDDRREFGDELKEVLSKTRLVEYSAVGIPSNEDSNTLAAAGVSDRLLRWWEDDGRPNRVWCEGGRCFPLDQLRTKFPQNSKVTVSMSVPEAKTETREACSCTATREAAASKGDDKSAHDNAYSVVANYTGGKSTYEQAVAALDLLTLPDGEKAKFKKTLDDFKAGLPVLPTNEAKDSSADASKDGPEHGPGRSKGGTTEARAEQPKLVLDDAGGFTPEACLQKAEELGYDSSTLMAEDIATGAMTESSEHGLAFGDAVKIACDHLLENPLYYEREGDEGEVLLDPTTFEKFVNDETANEQELAEEAETVEAPPERKSIVIVKEESNHKLRGGTSERPKLVLVGRSIESRVERAVSKAIERKISDSIQTRKPKIILG